MPRYAAFLRAINVGGHVVRMDVLRRVFEASGFEDVGTFIASGNVLFESAARDAARLEARIEAALQAALGYRVATFVRTMPELTAIAGRQPFAEGDAAGTAIYVAFLKAAPSAPARRSLTTFQDALNDFHVAGREIYWHSRGPFGGVGMRGFSGAILEKTLAVEATLRNMSTVRKLAAKCAGR
jgi:uncharacterized protein (DUF1697 family)